MSSIGNQMRLGGAVPVGLKHNVLLVNLVQQNNPMVQHIKNVKIEYIREMFADFATQTSCVLFLSVKFHYSHPDHILKKIRLIGKNYRTRVVLLKVDDINNSLALFELNKMCFENDFTLIIAWSDQECARYIESLREYEGKSSSAIQERVETEYIPRVTKLLTAVKGVNKTDVNTLLDAFGNLSNVLTASEQQLMLCPGLGEKKVKRLYQVLNESFLKKQKKDNNLNDKFPSSTIPPEKTTSSNDPHTI